MQSEHYTHFIGGSYVLASMANLDKMKTGMSEIINRFSDFGICEMVRIAPELNCRRFYRLEVTAGLFSPIVIRSWGRIGCRVKVKVDFYETIQEALDATNKIYRRRISRGYREKESLVENSVAVHPTQLKNTTIRRLTYMAEPETFLPFK